MKRLLLLLSCMCGAFANTNSEFIALEQPLPKVEMDVAISPAKYFYFTLGSSVLLQEVGMGHRNRNFETSKGHDFRLNANFSLPFLRNALIYPSIKYTYLNYKNNRPNSTYFGIAGECYGNFSEKLPLLPNIGLVWGEERENIRFTEFQLNLLPAAGVILGAGFMLFGSEHAFWISDKEAGALVALLSASVLCSYSAGF